MTDDAYPGAGQDRVAAQRSREAAFARIGRVRGLTILGAGALTAAIAAVVSAVAPGRTLGAKTVATVATHHSARVSRTRSSTHPGALKMPPLASPSQLGLGGPGAPPQASSQPQQSSPAPQTQTQSQPSAPAPQSSAPVQPAPQSAPGPVVSGGS